MRFLIPGEGNLYVILNHGEGFAVDDSEITRALRRELVSVTYASLIPRISLGKEMMGS